VLELELCPAFVSKEGFKALSKLQSLREFTFTGRDPFNKSRAIGWCFELMPQLHVAGSKPELVEISSSLLDCGEIMSEALHLVGQTRHLVLKLQYLTLIFNANISEENITLPELRVLSLIYPMSIQFDFNQFPQLTELGMFNTNEHQLMLVLAQVGQQLSRLHFSVNGEVQLDRVLQLCPNLSELSADVRRLRNVLPVQLQPLQCLLKLQLSYSNTILTHVPLFQSLRLAPNLRSFSLTLVDLDKDTLSRLVDLARERSCMQHLEQINVHMITTPDGFLSNHNMKMCRKMLESCAYFLDKLHTVEVSFDY
jgi:hypothetical protein